MLRQFTLVVDVSDDSLDRVIQAVIDSLGRLPEREAADKLDNHWSVGWFSFKFKESVGMTYKSFRQLIRLKIAAVWFETTNLRVSEIAYELGYSNPGKFGAAFKDQFRVCPRTYRRNSKNSNLTVTRSIVFMNSRYNVPPPPSDKMAFAKRAS